MLILGWVSASRRSAPTQDSIPSIRLLSPAGDTTVSTTFALVFEPGTQLRLLPTGWGAGRNHIHVRLNETEIMPAARDIEDLGNGRYRWTVQTPPGTYALQMIWSGPDHRALPGGESDTRSIHVE